MSENHMASKGDRTPSNENMLRKMTVRTLKQRLRERNLPVSGNKTDLLKRLNENVANTPRQSVSYETCEENGESDMATDDDDCESPSEVAAADRVRGTAYVTRDDFEIFRAEIIRSLEGVLRGALQAPGPAPSPDDPLNPNQASAERNRVNRAAECGTSAMEARQARADANPSSMGNSGVPSNLDSTAMDIHDPDDPFAVAASMGTSGVPSRPHIASVGTSAPSSNINASDGSEAVHSSRDPLGQRSISRVEHNSVRHQGIQPRQEPFALIMQAQNGTMRPPMSHDEPIVRDVAQSGSASSSCGDAHNHNRYAVKHAAENMPEFDPDGDSNSLRSADMFVTRLRALQAHYGYSNFVLLEAAQQKLRGRAKTWNDNSPQIYTTFDEFERDLRAMYPIVYSVADVLEDIFRAKQAPGESLSVFCHRMVMLGRRARLADADLAQYVIKRIENVPFLTAIACVPINSTTDLIRAIASFEKKIPSSVTKQPQLQTNNTGKFAKPAAFVGTGISASRPNQAGPLPKPASVCWNCKQPGHRADKCSAPQRKCTNCQRVGHLASECKSNARPERIYRIDGEPSSNGVQFEQTVTVGGEPFNAYIDGGTRWSLIGRTLAERLGTVESVERPVAAKGFNGEPVMCSHVTRLEVVVGGHTYSGYLHVVDDDYLEDCDMILGTGLLCGVGNFLLIGNNQCRVLPSLSQFAAANRSRVDDVLQRYANCFSDSLATLGMAKNEYMRIELTTRTPVCQRTCRIPFAQRETVSAMIADLLEHGIITVSTSPYASQLVIVQKSNGETRLCVDYRPLNAVTIKQPHPMPVVEEMLAMLAGNKYFTTLDLMSGYYQIPVEESSRKYTAFDTHEGHYEYTRMPFGLANAPSVFQAVMNRIKLQLPAGEVVVYMDDIIIPSKSIEEGLHRLERFLGVISEAGLTLRMSKCVFLAERIKFLGHNVCKDGIEPGDEKTAAIREFPTPKNVHEVRRFLGLTGYFRKFVPNYARIAKPLTSLLKTVGDPPFVWADDQDKAVAELQSLLCSSPVLCLYDSTREHEVHTDACAVGLAGALLQKETDGAWHPVMYYSRHCTPAESSYASHELEVLAITETLERFAVYLLGKKFTLVTDCEAVSTTKATKAMNKRVARWFLKLMEYGGMDIVHRPGTQLAHVDAMSRAPVEPAKDASIVTEKIMRIDTSQTDWVVTMQLQDESLQKIVGVLRKPPTDDASEKQIRTDYELKGHRLYRKVDSKLRWVVPNAIRWRVVKSAHDDRGHFGLEKTLDYLRAEFWFPSMRDFVKKYLAACIHCAMNKKPGGQSEGQMHITKTVPIPFHTVHVDHLGPFPRSSKRNMHIIAIVDSFSRYTLVRAVRSTDSRAVISLFNDMSTLFGLPSRIVSDRGTAYTSKQFAEFCKHNAIQHIKNAVRTPRANGQVERINSMIAMFLRTTHAETRKWDTHLNNFQWVINSQKNKTIGCCPNEVVFRFRLRARGDNQLLAALHETADEDEPEPLPTLDDIARTADTAKSLWKDRFDQKHRKPTTYAVDDLVLVEHQPPATGEPRKLEPKYRGPYVVKRVLDSDRYVVADLKDVQRNQRPFESVFASDKMKRWCTLGPESGEDIVEADESE